jgi:hypothetical protein
MVPFNMAEQVLAATEEPTLRARFHEVDRNQIGEAEIGRQKGILTQVEEALPAV